jgi:hypothetical protein
MTATIAGITAENVITGTTKRPSQDRFFAANFEKQKGEPDGPLFAKLLCRLRSAQTTRMFRERRAPRERCDQLLFSSKPGGVMIPLPEPDELTPRLYSPNLLNASEKMVKRRNSQDTRALRNILKFI